jgi:uncharacterized protein YdeI (YjbR/CyaY-like superfamily)
MEIANTLYLSKRDEWRSWLEEHHHHKKEVWLVYYRASTGQPGLNYDDSVEEPLCFGWIDSVIKKIDHEKYARKFTPRRAGSKWSASNKRRVLRMIEAGCMTPAGIGKVDFALNEVKEQVEPGMERPILALSEGLRQTLMESVKAWQMFNRLPASQQRQYIGWIMDAKKTESRQRRVKEVITMLEAGRQLGMK